jgi:hypothetical protein
MQGVVGLVLTTFKDGAFEYRRRNIPRTAQRTYIAEGSVPDNIES